MVSWSWGRGDVQPQGSRRPVVLGHGKVRSWRKEEKLTGGALQVGETERGVERGGWLGQF